MSGTVFTSWQSAKEFPSEVPPQSLPPEAYFFLHFQPILGHQQLLSLICSLKLEKQGFPKSSIPLLPLLNSTGFPFSLFTLSLVLSSF